MERKKKRKKTSSARAVKRGRRTRLTPELQEKITTAIRNGVPFRTACRGAGVSDVLACEWRQRGEGTHRRSRTKAYAEFAEAIACAKAQDEARRVQRIDRAGEGGFVVYEKTTTYPDGRIVQELRRNEPSWQADAFHLERAYADTWGKRERIDMRLTVQQAAEKIAAELGLTVEEVLAEAEGLLKA